MIAGQNVLPTAEEDFGVRHGPAAVPRLRRQKRQCEHSIEEDSAGERAARAQRRGDRPADDEELLGHAGGGQRDQHRGVRGRVRARLPGRDQELLPEGKPGLHEPEHRARLPQKGLFALFLRFFRIFISCHQIENRIRQEENRADSYLDRSTKPKLRNVIQEELITKYAKRLVEDEKTGCVSMFNRNLVEGACFCLSSCV